MICFNCGIKIHSNEAKVCGLCGVRFEKTCPSCYYPNPSMGKYCFNCGTKLECLDTQSSVQNFDTLSESRRNVAVIFADVSGFTALSEKLDPEEVREIINECFDYITRPVYELEGTIDKYIGDCVMILFGAKYIHTDDVKRAVVCAMRMMNLIEEFSKERFSSTGLSLTLSIGINYGLVVTGSVGNTFDRDYTVMGDIVNTAQRLQSNADSGAILVSESVYMETKDIIKYTKPVEIKVKNKEKPVRCYSPIEINAEHDYDDRTPFIGREKELGQLVSIYNNALNTGTKCISVIGEAGVGKTRLLKEFSASLAMDIKKLWVDISPFSQNRVYHLISNVLMKIMNINYGDNPNVKQRRLMSFLDYILEDLSDEEIERNYNFIGLILGLKRDNEFQNILNSMSFENIRREMIRQLAVFFKYLSKKFKMVIIIDDMHWSDKDSLSIIRGLMENLDPVNITFVMASRYEVEEFSDAKSLKYHTLKLRTLSKSAVKQLMCKLLQCKNIDKSLLDAAEKFTSGNPLYIREFIQNIKKSDTFRVIEDVAVIDAETITSLPNNIQNIILANLSEMSDEERRLLEVASVIGREFNLTILSAILEMGRDEVNDLLRLPVHMNLISLKSAYTSSGVVEKEFVFNQDMEREVIYDSILNKEKKELHKKIAEFLEEKYARELEEYYEILFTHFHKAGQIKKAAEYSFKTAIKNKVNFNFTSSLEYYDRFLQLVKEEDDEQINAKILEAYRDMGYIKLIMADYELSMLYLNRALKKAKLYDDIYSIRLMIAAVYKEQDMYDDALKILDDIQLKINKENTLYGKLLQMKCSILRILGSTEALTLAQKSEKLLIRMKDYENLAETMNQAGIIYYIRGDISNALFYLDKSYKYAEKVNNLAIMAKVSGNMGVFYHSTGMISKAQDFFARSISISKKISDQQGCVAGSINLGILYMDKGLFNEAEALFNKALESAREISSKLNESISITNIGDILYERGHFDQAISHYNKSLEIAREINVPVGEGINYLSLAKLNIDRNLLDMAEKMLDMVFKIFTEVGEMSYLSDCYRYRAICEMKKGNPKDALNNCDKAIEISQEVKSDIRRLKAIRIKAGILAGMDKNEEAVELLSESINMSHQLESDYEAAKGYYERFNLYKKMGDMDKAAADIKLAKECIGKVDDCKLKEVILKEVIE